MLENVTPVILTCNEEANISRCLERLFWARRIIVVDSGSTDATVELCRRHAQVDVCHRPFDCHANQWNFAIQKTPISTEWVLALDADFVLSPELIDEIAALRPSDLVSGFRVSFNYVIAGKRLRASLYPPLVVLFRRNRARYEQDGHTQRLCIEGTIRELNLQIDHDDRKTLGRWLRSQLAYATLEADKLFRSLEQSEHLSWRSRLRIAPPVSWLLIPVYILFFKRGFLDGSAGWFYALQRGIAEALISVSYIEKKLTGGQSAEERLRCEGEV